MQPDYMHETLKNLHLVWKRPVAIMTVLDNEKRIVRFDGKEIEEKNISELPKGDQNPG
mgnify:CR=1 FL=1